MRALALLLLMGCGGVEPRQARPSADPEGQRADAEQAATHYLYKVNAALNRQLVMPAEIPPEDWLRLATPLALKGDATGKLIGRPPALQPSGNSAFDAAAVEAVMRFGPGTPLRIPLPGRSLPGLRQMVLENGFRPTLRGDAQKRRPK